MKQLIKTIEQDEYSNKYYYNKMLSDFELESRYNALIRSKKNKFRSESLKYLERGREKFEDKKKKNGKSKIKRRNQKTIA